MPIHSIIVNSSFFLGKQKNKSPVTDRALQVRILVVLSVI
jgi:hypothetical protein